MGFIDLHCLSVRFVEDIALTLVRCGRDARPLLPCLVRDRQRAEVRQFSGESGPVQSEPTGTDACHVQISTVDLLSGTVLAIYVAAVRP